MSITRRHISLRIPTDDLKRIDTFAKDRRLDRTNYLILAGLQELDDLSIPQQLDELRKRVALLESSEFGGASY